MTPQSSKERPWGRFSTGRYLRTGDMAFMEGGRMYYFGRMKDMIIVRGENFYAQVGMESLYVA
jgi:acyl-CoA synthetase (AMP-forming)/AMP-acid ligase II